MKTMKLFYALTMVLFLASCSDDDSSDNTPTVQDLETATVTNLDAANADGYVKFSFSEGAVVTNDEWDIAVDGMGTILVNGGEIVSADTETDPNNPVEAVEEPARIGEGAGYIIESAYEDVTEVDAALLNQDAEGVYAIPAEMMDPENGWMYYDMETHLVSPREGLVIVVKTHDGKYAKMEITNFYENGDTSNAFGFGYYNFHYTYNPNIDLMNLEEE